MADWNDKVIAVDWGTTNRRAYAIGHDGGVSAAFEDGHGVTSVEPGGFAKAIEDIRERLGDAPMLLAGMIGSSRGWVDVPYVEAPAGLADLVAALYFVKDDVAIVPGVRLVGDRLDVMRGEEVQALGAVAAGLAGGDSRICHPGTHAKWITLDAGRLTDFRTAMTGEMFALLKAHSILHLEGEVAASAAFRAAVDMAISGEPLLDGLFSVRSRTVLGALAPEDTASWTSGFLIGTDCMAHAAQGAHVTLIGRPELCALYAAALDRLEYGHETIDGAAAFVAGMDAIRRTLP